MRLKPGESFGAFSSIPRLTASITFNISDFLQTVIERPSSRCAARGLWKAHPGQMSQLLCDDGHRGMSLNAVGTENLNTHAMVMKFAKDWV